MADVCVGDHKIVTQFLLDTCNCEEKPSVNHDALQAFYHCTVITTTSRPVPENDEIETIPLTTGSVAEFYIQPMLSCIGDIDVMYHYSSMLSLIHI